MNKWVAEFDLEDGDTMPEHMDLEYKGVKLDFHCRPKEPILDKIRAEIDIARFVDKDTKLVKNANASGLEVAMQIIDKYKAGK